MLRMILNGCHLSPFNLEARMSDLCHTLSNQPLGYRSGLHFFKFKMIVNTLVLLTGFLAAVETAVIQDKPKSLTVTIGNTARMQCGVTGDIAGDGLEWTEFASTTTGSRVFYSGNNLGTTNPEKYEIEGTYNLKIKNAQLTDGGEYGCKLVSEVIHSSADLVVVGIPLFKPPIPAIFENDEVKIQCVVSYGSRHLSELPEARTPKLSIFIANSLVTEYMSEPITEGSPSEGGYTVTTAAKYTAKAADNGYDFICEVGTENPQYVDRVSQKMDILFAVRDIVIEPVTNNYYVGDTIRCTASGNPAPTYWWTATSSPGARSISGAVLTIDKSMIGENTWKCTATNDARHTEVISDEIQFTVCPGLDDPQTTGSLDNTNCTVIGEKDMNTHTGTGTISSSTTDHPENYTADKSTSPQVSGSRDTQAAKNCIFLGIFMFYLIH